MPERRPYVAANWKMNKTVEETEAFLADFLVRAAATRGGAEVVVCPPYPSLKAAVELCLQSPVRVAAQNMHEDESGAYTGEVSAPMLIELGVDAVILGHSERRALFGETDEALAAGLEPILCIGETEAQRDASETEAVLSEQVAADLAAVDSGELHRVVVAYEPVWAIGTGRTATPEQAQDAIRFIRDLIRRRAERSADQVRILYGGSVKPDNAAELMGQPDIDGALVGGASLDPGDFAAIVEAAR
jgi:triosephosphate isomerase